ncbi:MAG: helix-turn-helix transcriptional regulator [Mariniphaga sp.]
MNIKEKFGLRIRELRKKNGISQEALAFKAGIDRTYMTSVENGKRNISIENIKRIIDALEISFQDFFTGLDIKE